MMNNEKIGIIVPVYKTEMYIAECIESILNQTYTNFRLILVDDGTPDNAGKICDEYAKKDNRITVIHQENAGVTRARARGVEEASDCEWITFVDSDDTITFEALNVLISATSGISADIIVTTINDFSKAIHKNGIIACEEYLYNIITEDLCSPVGKLFKRELFDSETFNTPRHIFIGEDLIMNLNIAYKATNSIVIINDKDIYNYNYNPNSAINTFDHSLEYEILFNDYITKKVMQRGKYLTRLAHALIKRRLLCWDRLFGYDTATPAWYGTKYHNQLISDIIKYKYPLGHIEHRLIKEKRKPARFFLILIRKISNKLSTIIRNHESKRKCK